MKKLVLSIIMAVALVFGGISIAQAGSGKHKVQTKVKKTTQNKNERGRANKIGVDPAQSSKKASTNPNNTPNDQPAGPAKD